MKTWATIYLGILFSALLFFGTFSAVTAKEEHDPQDCKQYGKVANKEGWCMPVLTLTGDLNKIFTIPETECRYISGMTCRITYNGKLSLPSEVYFIQFDKNGKKIGDKIRLIYPKLEANESGTATFRINMNPTTIKLIGKWDAPYKDPY